MIEADDGAYYTGVTTDVERRFKEHSGGGRIAYTIKDWQEAGGLQFPGALDNVGARNIGNSEVWRFSNVKIGKPNDALYIPHVR